MIAIIYKFLQRFDYPIKGYELTDVNDNSNTVVYGLKLIFDISFFIVILIIGLNVIFGIIVDTFRQLRDAKWRIEQDIETKCFSCGRDSYEFEQKGIVSSRCFFLSAIRDHLFIPEFQVSHQRRTQYARLCILLRKTTRYAYRTAFSLANIFHQHGICVVCS